MPKPIALLASSALLLPLAPMPAEAAGSSCPPGFSPSPSGEGCLGPATNQSIIRNCAKSKYGTTVRIKVRDEGKFIRVRVSHPDGDGNFYAPKVKRVDAGYSADGSRDLRSDVAPATRFQRLARFDSIDVYAIFKLRNGKTIHLECETR